MGLGGKVAVVTGAGSGIGRATARRFAAAGAHVVAVDLEARRCEDLDAVAIGADVTDEADVARVVRTAVERFGGLDVFHNNAGLPAEAKPVTEITREEWNRVLDVNLTAFFLAAQAVVPAMRERGGGCIIVTASIIARRPRPGLAAYIAAKTGVTGLARALALELAPDRIRVNVINPGPARTPMLARFGLGAARSRPGRRRGGDRRAPAARAPGGARGRRGGRRVPRVRRGVGSDRDCAER